MVKHSNLDPKGHGADYKQHVVRISQLLAQIYDLGVGCRRRLYQRLEGQLKTETAAYG